jgi:hypothetical protein
MTDPSGSGSYLDILVAVEKNMLLRSYSIQSFEVLVNLFFINKIAGIRIRTNSELRIREANQLRTRPHPGPEHCLLFIAKTTPNVSDHKQ